MINGNCYLSYLDFNWLSIHELYMVNGSLTMDSPVLVISAHELSYPERFDFWGSISMKVDMLIVNFNR